MGYGSNTLILCEAAFALITVTLVLLALLDVTVTGPDILMGLLAPMLMGPDPIEWLIELPLGFEESEPCSPGLIMDTCPCATLEC